MTIKEAINKLNYMYGDWRTEEEQEAISVAVIALNAWEEVSECVKFHKLKDVSDEMLTGFESFILEILGEVEE